MKNRLPEGIYAITAEKFSNGRDNIEIVEEMIAGGAAIIQYREKENKTINEKYQQCRAIRHLTREAGVLFVVNDAIDIAMLVDADGVHVGQDDLPVSEVRKLVGEEKIIGLSTHSAEQAQAAVKAGADYIGVGPIYKTATKDNVCAPVGLEYLEYVVKNISIPFVAIGGIKKHNLHEVVSRGAKTICLVTEIVEAENISLEINQLAKKIKV
jgi:thiamine-phosphate pyrophosphorylase